MSEDQIIHPKVFISYSWAVQGRVKELADRLICDGIIVVIDIYDLKEGQDKYKFMEQAVNSPEIRNVLIICDKTYAEKADNRTGGVGDETVIITPELYGNNEQTKFIPVIFEKDEIGNPFCPAYLKSRLYIDFSDINLYEARYADLLRLVYDKPLYKRPELGVMPEWLKQDDSITVATPNVIGANTGYNVNYLTADKASLRKILLEFNTYNYLLFNSLPGDLYDNIDRFMTFIQKTKLFMDFIRNLPKTKHNMNEVIMELLRAGGSKVFLFGTTDDEIIVNTYSFLTSSSFSRDNIIYICLCYCPSPDIIVTVNSFKERVLRPFTTILKKYLDKLLIDIETEEKHQIAMTINGGQVNISHNNSTISAIQNNNDTNSKEQK